jgi:hypothetical protein
MKTSIISLVLSLSFASVSFAAGSDKVESIPACGKGQIEVFAPITEVEFPSSTVELSKNVIKGIKGYLKAGQIPAICQEGKKVIFASR